MLRVAIQAIIELVLTVILFLIGLGLLVGTLDEYRSGKAFNQAMDNYAAREMEDVHDFLDKAASAKKDYSAPEELMGKLLIDDGKEHPKNYAEAKKLFAALREGQETAGQRPSLPVLIGQAVAQLEAVRARKPGDEELALAIKEARVALDKARDLYPESGDIHVNLAAIGLLAHDLKMAKSHLTKVNAVGSVSIDALKFLYNLNGLVALEEGNLPQAVAEFEKVKEFDPHWEVPQLNLAAAYAQSLFRGEINPAVADRYAMAIKGVLRNIARSKGQTHLLPLVHHALAVYRIRGGDMKAALDHFREAEKHGDLSWHGRFNRAVAQYLSAVQPRTTPGEREGLLEQAQPVFERALRSKHATPRDVFVAAACLGRIHAETGKADLAIESFTTALEVKPKKPDKFIDDAKPVVHRSLAAVAYEHGKYREALAHLERSKDVAHAKKVADRMQRLLSEKPVITDFSAKLGKIITDYDLRISASFRMQATPEPVTERNIRLTLANSTNKTRADIPFRLIGHRLHALLLNVPQGAIRIECQLTDSVGNKSEIAAKSFSIDREPPRVLGRKPGPGAEVARLDTIEFRLFDALGSVDLATVNVFLNYPATAKHTTRLLVSRGKLNYGSPDGAIQKGTQVRETVKAPVPDGDTKGVYKVTVRVSDVEGRTNEIEWSFTLR